MAFDQTKPATTDNYSTAFVPGIQANFLALAMWLDSSLSGITGTIPTGAKRYNRTSGRIEEYSGAAWGNLTVNASSADALNVANNYSAVSITLSNGVSHAGGIQFNNATSQDGYLQVDSGRTLRWRNGNAASPNWSVMAIETGGGLFHSSVQCGSAGAGYANLNGGPAGATGYVSFIGGNGIQNGYIGDSGNTGTTNTGTLNYVAGVHNFTGVVQGNFANFTNNITFGYDGQDVLLKSPSAGGAIRFRSNSGTTARGISIGTVDNVGGFNSKFEYLDATAQWVSTVNVQAPTFTGSLNGNATTATTATSATSATTQTAGNNSTLIATTAFVQTAVAAAPGLGVGQAWQSLTGSRSSGTPYSSPANRTISVLLGLTAVSGSPGATLVIGGVTVATWVFPYGTGNPFTFEVPPNTSYTLTLNAGTTIAYWSELR